VSHSRLSSGFAVGYCLAAGPLLTAVMMATLCEDIRLYGCVGVKSATAAHQATSDLTGMPEAGRRGMALTLDSLTTRH